MRRRTQLLWTGIALLSYLVASIAFLTVLFSAGLFGSEFTPESLSAADIAWILLSLALFAFGGYATWQIRRSTRPERSPLPSQFQHGPGASRPRPESLDDDPIFDDADSTRTVRCPNCGAENDPGYTFCRNCSEKLSD